jgi:hypothetical protein
MHHGIETILAHDVASLIVDRMHLTAC